MIVDFISMLDTYLEKGTLADKKREIEYLIDTSNKWTKVKPLDEVIVGLHLIYISTPDAIDGQILGILAKRLVESEVKVGGPYVSNKDLYTNILIANFLRSIGSPLEKLEKYISTRKYIPKTAVEQKVLISLLPKKTLIKNEKVGKKENTPSLIVKAEISKLDSKLQKIGFGFWNKILEVDTRNEVSLISSYVSNSIIKKASIKELWINEELGAANFCAWIAYTIYDDFIDGEGDPSKLSLANIMHRLSYELYRSLFILEKNIINAHFDSVDNSNFWELQNCRFKIHNGRINIGKVPEYNNGEFLAERAIGHILGPILIIKNRLTLNLEEDNKINHAFHQYLIARQINDDLKDWKDDLRKGHISYVLARLLKSININPGSVKIDTLMHDLEIEFWNQTFEKCINEIIARIHEAENIFSNSQYFKKNNQFILYILRPLKQNAESDLKEYLNSKDFLKYYSNN